MRQCLNYAVDKGYISSNPFSSVTIDSQRMLRRDTAEVVSHACHREIHRLLHKQKSSTKSWGAYTTGIP